MAQRQVGAQQWYDAGPEAEGGGFSQEGSEAPFRPGPVFPPLFLLSYEWRVWSALLVIAFLLWRMWSMCFLELFSPFE